MSNFDRALRNLDPDLMCDVVHNLGSSRHTPEGEDPSTMLNQYPAFAALISCLGERLDDNPNVLDNEKSMVMIGVITCMEAFADYVKAEKLRGLANGEQ